MPPFNPLEVSIIIPVYKNEKGLKRCLEALRNQSVPTSQYEVLVVNNGDSDELTRLEAEFSNFKFLHEEKKGSYAARNKGLEHAQGILVAFTDSDCIPDFFWIEEIKRSSETGFGTTFFAGKINSVTLHERFPNAVELYEHLTAFPQEMYVAFFNFGVTANLAVPKKIISEVGTFNDTLLSGGDREWCERAIKRGFKIRYCRKMLVQHETRHTLKEMIGKSRRLAGGQFQRCGGKRSVRVSELGVILKRFSIRSCWNLLNYNEFPANRFQKLSILWVVYLNRVFYLCEFIRLWIGGQPCR